MPRKVPHPRMTVQSFGSKKAGTSVLSGWVYYRAGRENNLEFCRIKETNSLKKYLADFGLFPDKKQKRPNIMVEFRGNLDSPFATFSLRKKRDVRGRSFSTFLSSYVPSPTVTICSLKMINIREEKYVMLVRHIWRGCL